MLAYQNRCPHQGRVMHECEVDEDSLGCPFHTVRYFLADGSVKDDSGFQGVDGLTRYEVELRDGEVHVFVPPDA